MEVKVVIGANYGDEGKGLVTNFFTTQAKGRTLNVLHNGGCQRGHTVVTNGKRHVFHCFGSGTLNGAETYYHKNFLADPIAWSIEVQQLGFSPKLWVDPNCRIVTPYDIASNRLKELKRGEKRHGSCGLGIFETITRSKVVPLYMTDLFNEIELYHKLRQIQQYYQDQDKENARFFEQVELDEFFRSVHLFIEAVETTFDCIYREFNTIIFEGGQGLRLDIDNKADFPYLTPSNTGSAAIVVDIQKLVNKYNANVEVCYITRPYLTRHGAGPLKNECKMNELSSKIVDITNQPNPWQGTIRYAPIDLNEFEDYVNWDMYLYSTCGLNVKFSLALTQAHLSNNKIFLDNNRMTDLDDIDLLFNEYYIFTMERIDAEDVETQSL